MGSVIFPGAELKVFLTASAEERAARRYRQLLEAGAIVRPETVAAEIATRDARDSGRAFAPLVAAPGAIVLDSTGLTADQVVERVLALARERRL